MNVTIGQYYPEDSFIHRLDPRVKLLGVVLFITALFITDNFLAYGFFAVCLGFVVYAAKVPPKFMFRGLKSLIFIMVFASVLNVFFSNGETVLFSLWSLRITAEGIIGAVKMSLRLIMMVVGSSALTLTTTPIRLTDALEYVLKPFKKIGLPAHDLAMMMTIALRFIPLLMEEIDRIMKAQMARGADFDTGGLIKKVKSLIPLLVPLFISAFRRADDLATAMEARCYRGDINRTKMVEMKMNNRDRLALVLLAGFTGITALFLISL